jgi:hypothetical protein
VIRFFDDCDVCKSETRTLWKLGIQLENRTLCRTCYEFTLENVVCNSNRKTLCQNMKCRNCYNRSLASVHKAFNIDFSQAIQLNLKFPRFVLKQSNKKYPFVCDIGHRWPMSPAKLNADRWCPNLSCSAKKRKQTCLKKFGVAHSSQSEEIKEKMRQTCLSNYGVKSPFQSKEIREKIKQTWMRNHGVEYPSQSEKIKEKIKRTCMKNHGVSNPMQSEKIKQKSQQTCLKNHGVKNSMQSAKIREKSRQTCLKIYGVKCSLQSDRVKEKIKQICMKRYGVQHFMQSAKVREKNRLTCMKNYGVEYPTQLEKFKEKSRQTCLKNHGVKNSMQSKKIREKSQQTCIRNHGVRNPMQCPKIFGKQQKSAFKFKEYKFPSGRITQVQGYEPAALNALILIYNEQDIQTSFENQLAIDYYSNDGKSHVYYPDIFVTSENMIIEVKSTYTYDLHKEKNELKARACVEQGYKFQFYIIDRKLSIDVQNR